MLQTLSCWDFLPFFQSSNDVVAMILSIVIGYYGSTIHQPRLLFLLSICAGIGSLLFITPMFLSDELNTTIADENKSFHQVHEYQTNSSGISAHQLFLCKGSSQPTVQTSEFEKNCFSQNANDKGPEDQNSSSKEVLLVLVVASIFVGIGKSGLHILSVIYIDQNASKERSAFYIGLSLTSFICQ